MTVVGKCRSGEHTSVISQPILTEVEAVLRTKFHVPDDKNDAFFQSMIVMSDMVFISGSLSIIEDDPKDNMVLETAIMGDAEYIVTGDKHLLNVRQCGNVKIMKTSEFLLRC